MLPGLALTDLTQFGRIELSEPGEDYATNAAAKALAASRATGQLTLADDSGIEVDALGGAPGWRSARYAGTHGDDPRNRRKLLEALMHVPPGARRARFRCALALADARGPLAERVLFTFGECEGSIALKERGSQGFGYDPLFLVVGRNETIAEIAPETKNQISHRGRAAKTMLPIVRAYLLARGARAEGYDGLIS